MKTQTHKLTLKKEAVTELNAKDLLAIKGGTHTFNDIPVTDNTIYNPHFHEEMSRYCTLSN